MTSAIRRRPKINIIAFTVTVLVAVAGMVIADLWWRRDRVLKAADTRAANLAMVLAEYVHGSFSSADAALRQLAIHGRRIGGPSASHEVWDAILAAAKTALPVGSGSISVTDRNGILTHSTQRLIEGQSRRDNYIFKRLSSGQVDELVLDKPFLSVAEPKRYILPVGRPLTTADGAFDGIAVATVTPESYRAFLGTLDIGKGGILTVLHPEGSVLFRIPSTRDPIGESGTDRPLLQRSRENPRGAVHAPLVPGGPQYISAYRTIGQPPVMVAVSLSEDAVLEDWRSQRRVSATAFGALTLTLGAMVMMLFRVVDARERIQNELRDVQDQESERLRDANERLEAALERERRAREETEAASYLKDEFLMTVSHELRTPLTAIYGWARVLSSKELDRPQQGRAIAAIERNAYAQTRLIDDLLDVSRAISGKLRLDATVTNVADVLRAAVETVSPAMAAKQLVFETDFDPLTPPILADPDRLQQIVWNLLSNAIKFTPESGTVRLQLVRTESQVEIVVSDTGSGIGAEFLPYVFERFRQEDGGSKRRYGGLGLGLAIVRHLVELHGGTVSAASAGENQGATFRVRLPIRPFRADARGASAAAVGARPGSSADRLDGIRVLVVDDEADARELFGSILQSAGAQVSSAPSAADALRILAEQPVDVLVSDIEMPGEDGYALLERAVKARGGARLPAVALTAYARAADRRRALDAGFTWHLAKPVEPSELVAAIAAVLPKGQ